MSQESNVAAIFRQTTSILSWLHQNLINEIQILQCTALDRSKFLEVLNSIFGERLPQRISLRMQAQIDGLVELKAAEKIRESDLHASGSMVYLY